MPLPIPILEPIQNIADDTSINYVVITITKIITITKACSITKTVTITITVYITITVTTIFTNIQY